MENIPGATGAIVMLTDKVCPSWTDNSYMFMFDPVPRSTRSSWTRVSTVTTSIPKKSEPDLNLWLLAGSSLRVVSTMSVGYGEIILSS